MLLGLLSLTGQAAYGADAEVPKEYQIKAAFLYNFTKFVEWPAARFASASSPIVIAVLGENPFGDELAKLVKGRRVNGREIVIKSVTDTSEADSVHVLFICARNDRQLGPALAQLRADAVLTVGESAAFASAGGVITFTLVEDKVRFEINQAAGEQAGLKISSQLLKLAVPARPKN